MDRLIFGLLLFLGTTASRGQEAKPVTPGGDSVADAFTGPSRLVSVKDYGAKGDGVTDDTSAINAAIDAVSAAGGGTVVLPPTEAGYLLKRAIADQQYGGIMLKPGVSLRGENTKLLLAGNCSFIYAGNPKVATATVTAATHVGDTTLQVDEGSRFTKGQTVLIRLGQSDYDSGEPEWWMFATVGGCTKQAVLLDRPIQYAMALDRTPAAQRSVWAVTRIENISVQGFQLINPMTGSANAEAGVNLSYCRNVHVQDITADNPGPGAVLAQYCDDLDVQRIHVRSAARQGGQPSKGRAISLAECRDVTVRDFAAENFASAAVLLESQCTGIQFQGVRLDNNADRRDNDHTALFGIIYKNQVTIQDLNVMGHGSYVEDEGGEGGTSSVEILTSSWSTFEPCTVYSLVPYGNGPQGQLRVGGTTFRDVRHWSKTFPLLPAQTGVDIALPQGTFRRVTLTVSSTVGLSSFSLVDSAGDAFDFIQHGLQPAVRCDAWNHSGLAWPGAPGGINRDRGKKTAITTTAAVPPGAYGQMEIEYYPN